MLNSYAADGWTIDGERQLPGEHFNNLTVGNWPSSNFGDYGSA